MIFEPSTGFGKLTTSALTTGLRLGIVGKDDPEAGFGAKQPAVNRRAKYSPAASGRANQIKSGPRVGTPG